MPDGHVARLNAVEYAAQAERLLDAVLLTPAGSLQGRAGIRPGGLAVSIGGSPESVIVAPGVGVINTGSNADGSYRFAIPAAVSKPLGARPSAGTSRIDLVVARVLDADIPALSTTQREVQIEIVTGIPGAAPNAPALPPASLLLKQLTVPASGSIAVGGIVPRTVASGGVLPVASVAERDALPAYDGLVVYVEAIDDLQVRRDGAWVTVTPTRPQAGTESITVGSSTNPVSKNVTFPTPFDTTPRVVVNQIQGDSTFYHAWVSPGSVTPTGFNLSAKKTGPSGVSAIAIDWIALPSTS